MSLISSSLMKIVLVYLVYVLTFSKVYASGHINLTVGYLANMHGKPRQGIIISGAMTYAVKQVNERKILPDNYTLEFIYEDTRGETLLGTNAVINMWRKGVVAFFGPENSCEVEATVSASVNLPMISYKCADAADKDDIANKDYRYHFARTYPPNTKVVSSVFELLRYYKWYKFSIIYEKSEIYETVYHSLEKNIEEPFVINHEVGFRNSRICCFTGDRSCCVNPFVKVVQNTTASTRIYLFLGDTTDLGQLLTALQMRGHLATGKYMVIYVDMETYSEEDSAKYFRQHEKGYEVVMMAAQSLLVLVTTPPRGDNYTEFENKVRVYNGEEPFKSSISTLFPNRSLVITPYASYLYDAVTLYADALAKALRNKTDPMNGREIMRIFRERTQYTSVTGAIMRIDKDGGSEGNYTVLAWTPTPSDLKLKAYSGHPDPPYCMLPVGRFYATDSGELRFSLERDIFWVIRDKPPVDEPPCGFDGSGCTASPDRVKEYILLSLTTTLITISLFVYILYKNWKYEQEIDGLLWKLERSEIQRYGQDGLGMIHYSSRMSLTSHMSTESKIIEQIFTKTAVYKGQIIAYKPLRFSKKIADIPRQVKKEMKLMREMHHDNINQFIGACVEENCIEIITEYCSKGSLQDILENDDMKLDNMFIASLVFDLLKGMTFLCESDIKFHGNLKSSNCVVTSRWVLQVTDFGLHELRSTAETTGSVAEHQYYRNLLWKAPELLRFPTENRYGSPKSDVYAFGIILHEIIARQGPFGSTDLTPREIISKVKREPKGDEEPFRPPLQDVQCQDYVVNAMKDAWDERPENRPDFHHLKERLRKMREGMKSNIMDNMMSMMEKYAYNLEELVEERTVALVEEKKKTEALLHRMLPKSVATQLLRGEAVLPESFDAVTIYFSDIVGFTAMSATSTPMEVSQMDTKNIRTLFCVIRTFILHYFDVYKVETIGDAYMVVSGLPIRNGDMHAGQIAFMALELLESIRAFKIRHKQNDTLKLRIGIHTGPVCAGVVGLTMPRYCLFGDAVNTASRMESNGQALKIHISPQCKEYLDKLGGYQTTERGLVNMKGKGEILTYWLEGHVKGPKKRTNSAAESVLPLFNVTREENAKRLSPKLADPTRRGSMASRRNSSFVNNSEEPPTSPGGVPVFLRLSSTESPRSPKRIHSFGRGDPAKLLKIHTPSNSSWYGNASASSCGDLQKIGTIVVTPEVELGPVPKGIRSKPKLESIGSEDCDVCGPEQTCNACNKTAESNKKNGMLNLDESMRPLLSHSKDGKVGLLLSTSEKSSSFLKPPVLRIPSKKWRSCDEIILPKNSKNSLKEFFTGLLGNKTHESEFKRANNFSLAVEKEESLV
ncbi:receptor-type guanylate cyclase Gyc76C [Parasteatoda tepidariorum]|nr:receptor-type guanylate cyclase Gyc76C [Parasteatoda tepidariorum]